MEYKDLNDFELISYVRENSEEANRLLFEKYKPLIESNARKLLKFCKYNGLEFPDLVQEGMLGLSRAIDTFNESKETSFFTYAKTCIERKQRSIIVMSGRQKHKALNESLPFEVYDEDEKDLKSVDIFLADNSYNPETVLQDLEDGNELKEKIKNLLTNFELEVFELKIAGFDYNEISEILEKDKKQIDNAIQRIKTKLKSGLK